MPVVPYIAVFHARKNPTRNAGKAWGTSGTRRRISGQQAASRRPKCIISNFLVQEEVESVGGDAEAEQLYAGDASQPRNFSSLSDAQQLRQALVEPLYLALSLFVRHDLKVSSNSTWVHWSYRWSRVFFSVLFFDHQLYV